MAKRGEVYLMGLVDDNRIDVRWKDGGCTLPLALPTCTVASGATLAFGSVVALASTGDVTTNSGTSVWVNCTADVAAAPTRYSATTRALVSGGNGTNQTVTLHGKIRAVDFKALPSGAYSRSVTLTAEY